MNDVENLIHIVLFHQQPCRTYYRLSAWSASVGPFRFFQFPRLSTDISLAGVVIVFSIIVLGLCAHITNLTTSLFIPFYFTFAAMGIATVILTWAGLGTL